MIRVELTDADLELAVHAGAARHIAGLRRGATPSYRFAGDCWGIHIEGAAAEIAVAHALGVDDFTPAVYRERPQTSLEGDVGRFQVRSTPRLDGSLILHPRDEDDATFILAAGMAPSFRIIGWTKGRIGKAERYWRSDVREPAYFVPQRDLRPIPQEHAA